jgi:hypothetical protein
MIDRLGARPSGARIGRFALCSAVVLGATAASWITPPPEPQAAARLSPPTPLVPRAGSPVRTAAQPGSGLAQAPLAVTQWGFRGGAGAPLSAAHPIPAGQTLTLWMKLDGDMAAVDQIRRRGSIAIEVHWTRETAAAAAPGAPNLVTRLTIGHPGLADRLAAEVRRTGFFEWHSWAEKSALSPGRWEVSLTYPDGRPLSCGNPPTPCRLHFEVG